MQPIIWDVILKKMSSFLTFLIEFCLLLSVSRIFIKSLSRALFVLTKNRFLTLNLIALIFFPGVVVHELAHLLTAGILFVHVGRMELMPEIGEKGQIRLGSVEVAKTGPIRHMLVGIAPMIFGLVVILASSYLIVDRLDFVSGVLVSYLFFVVGNTMFSSKKDLEGVLELLVFFAFILAALYFFRVDMVFSWIGQFLDSKNMTTLLGAINKSLLWTIGIDALGLVLASAFLRYRRQ